MLEALADHDSAAALALLEQSACEGVQPAELLGGLIDLLRDAMILAVGAESMLLAISPRNRGQLKSIVDRWTLQPIMASLQILRGMPRPDARQRSRPLAARNGPGAHRQARRVHQPEQPGRTTRRAGIRRPAPRSRSGHCQDQASRAARPGYRRAGRRAGRPPRCGLVLPSPRNQRPRRPSPARSPAERTPTPAAAEARPRDSVQPASPPARGTPTAKRRVRRARPGTSRAAPALGRGRREPARRRNRRSRAARHAGRAAGRLASPGPPRRRPAARSRRRPQTLARPDQEGRHRAWDGSCPRSSRSTSKGPTCWSLPPSRDTIPTYRRMRHSRGTGKNRAGPATAGSPAGENQVHTSCPRRARDG